MGSQHRHAARETRTHLGGTGGALGACRRACSLSACACFGIHGEPPLSSTGALVELHDDIAAFLNDDGKVEHAAGAAVADRTRLRDAARSITRARTKTRKRDVNWRALLEWQSLEER